MVFMANDLNQMVNFRTRIFDYHSPALLDLLDPRPPPQKSYKIGSVHLSFRLSVSFLGIDSLVFLKLSTVLGAHT